jgi:hypothetical protein
MKRSRRQGSPRILKTDLPSLLLSWLKGVWGSLRRFVMRLLRPNRGRRNYVIELQSEKPKPHICPLVGVEGLEQAGSLTVSDLMEKVQWRGALQWNPLEETTETFNDSIVAVPKIRSGLKLDKPHISPLVGIERFKQSAESLTVSDLMEKVQWHPAGEPTETFSDSIAAVTEVCSGLKLDKPHISPLVGIERFKQSAESLTVGDLTGKIRWRSDTLICPLEGVEQIGYAESLSVSNLMERVLWRLPGETAENFADLSADSSIAPVQETLTNNAHIRPLICPLVGIEQLSLTESLTVGNLMASVQWRLIKKASKASPKTSPKTSSPSNIASIPDEINWD